MNQSISRMVLNSCSSHYAHDMHIMGLEIVSLIVAFVLCLWAFSREKQSRQQRQTRPLPPGPTPWPVVGNIFQLGFSPHRSLARLAKKHGPVMTLHLGSMATVVVSSASAANEMFRLQDTALSGRVIYEAMKLSSGSDGSIITAQNGPHWRMLRRLCTAAFLANSRLESTEGIRRCCVDSLVKSIDEMGASGTRPVNLRRLLFLSAFDHIGHLVLSKDLLESNRKEGNQFFHHARKIMELAGKPNIADFVPVLRRLDPQCIRRKMDHHVGRALDIVAKFVEERMTSNDDSSKETKDLLDVLLNFEGDGVEEPAKLSSRTINNLIFEMFVAGTDTSTSTLEWAMAELLKHPTAMSKVQTELERSMLTTTSGALNEKDFVNLPYLNAVVKETLRLHPPLPLLVPHKALKSCALHGYHISEGTQVIVNAWGLCRDPKLWREPSCFRPERFLEEASGVDFRGQHIQYIPFGSGRRMCPAVPIMSRMLPLVLGTLLVSFNWALPDGVTPDNLDMGESMGIALRKAVPVSAVAVPKSIGWTRI